MFRTRVALHVHTHCTHRYEEHRLYDRHSGGGQIDRVDADGLRNESGMGLGTEEEVCV